MNTIYTTNAFLRRQSHELLSTFPHWGFLKSKDSSLHLNKPNTQATYQKHVFTPPDVGGKDDVTVATMRPHHTPSERLINFKVESAYLSQAKCPTTGSTYFPPNVDSGAQRSEPYQSLLYYTKAKERKRRGT